MQRERLVIHLAPLLTSLLLGACGGGGGGPAAGESPKAWGTAQLIQTGREGAFAPAVAADGTGDAIAVWPESDGHNWTVMASRYDAAAGRWAAPLAIGPATPAAGSVQIAVDGRSNAIATWVQFGTGNTIWANRYDSATGLWGTAQAIDSSGPAQDPAIAMDGSGNALVVWAALDATNTSNVWVNRYEAASGRWNGPQLLESGSGDAYEPQVAMNAAGDGLAVWSQVSGSPSVFVRRYDGASSAWGTTVQAIGAGTGAAGKLRAVMDPAGNAVVVWEQRDGTEWSIYANRYRVGSGWGAAGPIDAETGTHSSPRIAMDADGKAMVVWSLYDGARESVRASRYDAAAGWSAPERVDGGAGSAQVPDLAIDPDGTAFAVWEEWEPTDTRLDAWANRYVPGAGWGHAELLERDDRGDAHYVQVAATGGGNAVAVWLQWDGTRERIWANRFE